MSHQVSLYTFQPSNLLVTHSDDGQALAQASGEALSDTMILNIPANLQYVNVLGATLRAFLTNLDQLAEPEVTLYNLELAIYEIGVNIVTHAYANARGRIQMSATLSNQPLQITITLDDTGISFNPDVVPEPCLGELQEHGYGLFLVKQLLDEVEYKRTATGNAWKLIKNLAVATS